MNNGQEANQGRRSILSPLRQSDVSQEIQRSFGGSLDISAQDLLRSGMYGGGNDDNGAETRDETVARASLRWESSEQRSEQSSNAMPILSRLLALALEEARIANFWTNASDGSSWEDGVPRVASGVKNRVSRLKGLGNAVVPQIPELIGRAIMKVADANVKSSDEQS